MSADPAPDMTDFTSAKSRLIRPGVVIRSVMPWTPDSSTWSAALNASSTETCRSEIDSRRSFGMTISVSTSARSRSIPVSAWTARRLPSKPNGRVTTPIVSAPSERATLRDHRGAAGAGAAALARGDEDHVGALEHLLDLLAVVFGGLAPTSGFAPGAKPAGQFPADVELDVGVAHQRACASVLIAMNSTPLSPSSIMRLTALTPPPPIPTTLMTAR